MGMNERVADRDRDRDDVPVRQPAFGKQRVQRGATHQLGDEIGAVIVDRSLVERDDAGVRKPRCGAGLTLKAPSDDALPRQDLDRHLAVKPLIVSHPDDAERTRPETAQQSIAPEHQRRIDAGAPRRRRAPVAALRVSAVAERCAVGSWLALMERFSTPRPRSLRRESGVSGAQLRALARVRACKPAAEVAFPAVSPVILGFSEPRKERERLSFFDEADEPPAAPRTSTRSRRPSGSGRRPPGGDQQSIQTRRIDRRSGDSRGPGADRARRPQLPGQRPQQCTQGLRQQRLLDHGAVQPDRPAAVPAAERRRHQRQRHRVADPDQPDAVAGRQRSRQGQGIERAR